MEGRVGVYIVKNDTIDNNKCASNWKLACGKLGNHENLHLVREDGSRIKVV